MPRDPQKIIWDMPGAAERLSDYVKGMTPEQYRHDQRPVDAFERCFTIIGEAMGRLVKDALDVAGRIDQQRAIRSFRNVLVHHYDTIDPDRVLHIAQNDLPDLIRQMRVLLGKDDRLDA